MSEIILNQPRVAPLVRQCKPATVSEHVRMNFDTQSGAFADLRTYIVEGLSHHRAALRQKYQRRIAAWRVCSLPEPRPQSTNLISLQRLAGRQAAFKAAHKQPTGIEINIGHPHVHEFANPKCVPVGEQHHGNVPNTVSAVSG